jgi:hypothetical protein
MLLDWETQDPTDQHQNQGERLRLSHIGHCQDKLEIKILPRPGMLASVIGINMLANSYLVLLLYEHARLL